MSESTLIFGSVFPFIGVLYGKKFSGKTVLIKHTIYSYRNKFAYVVCFSATAEANRAYDFLPKEFVHSEYKPDVMSAIIKKQLALKKRLGDNAPHCLIVFDDCIGMDGLDFRKQKNNELKLLFSSNRHWHISLLISTQGVKEVPPLLRNNCDGAFIFKSLNNSLDDLYTCYSNMPKKEFYEFVNTFTTDWRIIYYNARAQNNKEIFTIFKVPESMLSKSFKLLY